MLLMSERFGVRVPDLLARSARNAFQLSVLFLLFLNDVVHREVNSEVFVGVWMCMIFCDILQFWLQIVSRWPQRLRNHDASIPRAAGDSSSDQEEDA